MDRPGDEPAGAAGTGKRRIRPGPFELIGALAAGLTLSFLLLPLIAIFLHGDLAAGIRSEEARAALWLSLQLSLVSLAVMVVVGTPLAYLLATRSFPSRSLVMTAVELPLVLPPAVAGIGLLAAVGSGGLFGATLRDAGISLPFTEAAVVLAITFVASPFYIRQAISAFESVDPNMTDAARTLGAGPARTFWRIGLPLAAGGLLAGWVLAFARGIG